MGINLSQVIDNIIAAEGGYVDHPDDRGGPTMYGITEKVARAAGHSGPISELSRDTARVIYTREYYVKPGFSIIADHSPAIAAELTDTGVNMGPQVAISMLQRCLNAFNDGDEMPIDGVIGPTTANALAKFLARRGSEGETVMLKALNCLQGARYIELTVIRPANESFVYGWIKNRV